ncbi:uncharacterized protein LOC120717163 [Simochromis diagramma]|uniref:uncharacterized protein LOC120717163 n=1 Tax=Simochromis diagramma TaxID=43689 RepID=UPI001A7E1CDA|nr:uncharacterized protein LOC120717163 [Simochromis diagramma]
MFHSGDGGRCHPITGAGKAFGAWEVDTHTKGGQAARSGFFLLFFFLSHAWWAVPPDHKGWQGFRSLGSGHPHKGWPGGPVQVFFFFSSFFHTPGGRCHPITRAGKAFGAWGAGHPHQGWPGGPVRVFSSFLPSFTRLVGGATRSQGLARLLEPGERTHAQRVARRPGPGFFFFFLSHAWWAVPPDHKGWQGFWSLGSGHPHKGWPGGPVRVFFSSFFHTPGGRCHPITRAGKAFGAWGADTRTKGGQAARSGFFFFLLLSHAWWAVPPDHKGWQGFRSLGSGHPHKGWPGGPVRVFFFFFLSHAWWAVPPDHKGWQGFRSLGSGHPHKGWPGGPVRVFSSFLLSFTRLVGGATRSQGLARLSEPGERTPAQRVARRPGPGFFFFSSFFHTPGGRCHPITRAGKAFGAWGADTRTKGGQAARSGFFLLSFTRLVGGATRSQGLARLSEPGERTPAQRVARRPGPGFFFFLSHALGGATRSQRAGKAFGAWGADTRTKGGQAARSRGWYGFPEPGERTPRTKGGQAARSGLFFFLSPPGWRCHPITRAGKAFGAWGADTRTKVGQVAGGPGTGFFVFSSFFLQHAWWAVPPDHKGARAFPEPRERTPHTRDHNTHMHTRTQPP